MHGRFKEDELGRMVPYQRSSLGLDTAQLIQGNCKRLKIRICRTPVRKVWEDHPSWEFIQEETSLLLFHRGVVITSYHQFRIEKYLKLVNNFLVEIFLL